MLKAYYTESIVLNPSVQSLFLSALRLKSLSNVFSMSVFILDRCLSIHLPSQAFIPSQVSSLPHCPIQGSVPALVNINLIFYIYKCFFFWLCWVFVATSGLSPVTVKGAPRQLQCVWASQCGGSSCGRAWALERTGSVTAAHRLSCSMAQGIFLDQGSNPCPLHWQADS